MQSCRADSWRGRTLDGAGLCVGASKNAEGAEAFWTGARQPAGASSASGPNESKITTSHGHRARLRSSSFAAALLTPVQGWFSPDLGCLIFFAAVGIVTCRRLYLPLLAGSHQFFLRNLVIETFCLTTSPFPRWKTNSQVPSAGRSLFTKPNISPSSEANGIPNP
jgi:hypothetical protein